MPVLTTFDKGRARRPNQRGLLWALVVFMLLAGCTKQIRKLPTIEKKDASLEGLLHLYQSRLEADFRFKALLEVKTQGSDKGGHTLLASWQSTRDTIRIRGFNLFGGTLFELQLQEPSFSLNIPSENKKLVAPLSELEQAAGGNIPFGSLELLEWVKRGGVPLVDGLILPALEKGEDLFILYLFTVEQGKARLREKVWIERSRFWAKKIELFDRAGLRRGLILLDDYRWIGGRHFPFSIRGKTGREMVTLDFREVSQIPTPNNQQGDGQDE